jgi:protein TonB
MSTDGREVATKGHPLVEPVPAEAASVSRMSPPAAARPRMPPRSASDNRIDSPRAEAAPKAGEALAHAPDTTYYTARQLDIYPALLEPLRLDYLTAGGTDDGHGHALLELQIGETGIVHAATVLETQPSGQFEDELRSSFLGSRFTPAIRDGRPVRSRVRVRVDFGADPVNR